MDVPLYDTLAGQVVLVTGATRGIGRRIADGLVEHGATVYAGARDTGDITADDRQAIELDVTVETDITDGSAPRTPEKGAETPIWLSRFHPDGPSGEFWRDRSPKPW